MNMLKIEDGSLSVVLSGSEVNGNIPQGALADLFELRRIKAVAGERELTLCKEIRPFFVRSRITQKGKSVVVYASQDGKVEEGSFNVKLALNVTRNFEYKERLIDAYTEIELLKTGVRRTKKNVAAARITAEALLKSENDAVAPKEGAPKVLVTHKEN